MMRKLLQNGNRQRITSASIGLLTANFVMFLLVDQFGFGIHPNVAASGALLLAAVINKLVSKYFK